MGAGKQRRVLIEKQVCARLMFILDVNVFTRGRYMAIGVIGATEVENRRTGGGCLYIFCGEHHRGGGSVRLSQ